MTSSLAPLRLALRSLLRAPGFTALAVLTLALGIGGNTAIFSVVEGVLLRPLPFDHPGRVVVVHNVHQGEDRGPHSSSLPDFEDWARARQVFSRAGLFAYWTFNLTGGTVPERLVGGRVTGEFFPTLGTRPLLGRTLVPADDVPGSPEVVVLGYRVWQRSFGGDPKVVGRVVKLEGRPQTVVGVMPRDFRFPEEDVELWAPIHGEMQGMPRQSRFMFVVGRLPDGASLARAQSALDVVSTRLQVSEPATNKGYTARLVPALESQVGPVRLALLMLFGAVGAVLIIAGANVANLLLARAAAREGESAVRAALGAGRWRLFTHFLAESLVLGGLGGIAGLVLGYFGLHLLVRLHPGGIPRLDEVTLNLPVLGFAGGLALATGVALSLFPALKAVRLDLQSALRERGRGNSGPRRMLTRSGLVVCEVALAMVLSVCSGLLFKSFVGVRAVAPGFATERVLMMSTFLTAPGYNQMAERTAYVDRALDALRGVPGVEIAAATTDPPLADGTMTMSFYEDGAPRSVADSPMAVSRAVSPEYFRSLQIDLVAGRQLAPSDVAASPRVAVVNESFARRVWPGADALGKSVHWSDPQRDVGPIRVVGVVRDGHSRGLEKGEGLAIYVPIAQITFPWLRSFNFVTRTVGDPRALTEPLRRTLQAVDPDRPVFGIRPLDEALDASLAERRFNMLLVQLFAALALLLSAVGIFGVVSSSVTERRREIGIRVALGGRREQITRLVVRQGMRPIVAGITLGAAGALVASRLLVSQLYAVRPTDPMTFTFVAAWLTSVALVACFLPARRATRVDPALALRQD